MRRPSDLPDWRDAHSYAPLDRAERPGFAWEWLRRLPCYRAAALRDCRRRLALRHGVLEEQPSAFQWGLHAFEDPALSFTDARPLWRSERHRFVLEAVAESSRPDRDSFELDPLRRFATLATGSGTERLLLSDGYSNVRLDSRGASLLAGPVRLSYGLAGIASAGPPLLVLQRFLAFASGKGFSRSLHRPDRRARRQILLLRAFDALEDGADQRTIAAELLNEEAAESRWRIRSPSLRSQAQRLAKAAREMAGGGFWRLLA